MVSTSQAGFELNLNERPSSGKENMIGKAIFRGSELLCPVSTSSPLAIAEQPELRAYKLGKQKCSYNQVELVIKDVGAGKISELRVSEAIETCVGPEVDEMLRESCLKFNVRFVNNNRMHLYIYVVYATPYGTSRTDNQSVIYHWIPVTRAKCRKACKGPVIRGLQRFGRMPRRNATGSDGEDSWKEPRHLYIAIDEASTHVCPRHETSKFRLLVAAYDDKNQLLGTTVSSSIRVLANNDAPLGAASFKLHCHIKGGWGTRTSESPIRNAGPRAGVVYEKSGISRPPLQDIIQNSSPPRSYRLTTTDETVKHGELASTHASLPGIDLNKQIFDHEKEADENNMSDVQPPQATTVELHDSAANSKAERVPEHSLTDLCERLLVACVLKQEYGQAAVALRSLATALGARRRRILEIMNVLETISVVQDQGKERYLWLGSTQIARALLKLKGSVREEGDSVQSSRSFMSPDAEINKPMQSLSKKFVQLFLLHEKASHISWEQMLEYIVDGQGHMNDPETIRAKTRRLGEVARIFTSLHLIKKVNSQKSQPTLVYEWLGSQGVAEHLATLPNLDHSLSTGIRKIDGRRTRTYRRRSRSRSPTNTEKKGSGAGRGMLYDNSGRTNDLSLKIPSLEQMSLSSSSDHSKFKDQPGEASARARQATSKYSNTDENANMCSKIVAPRKKKAQKPFETISTNQAVASGSISDPLRTSCGDFTLDTAFRLCQSSLSGHIRGEIASQLELSLSYQLCQLPNWKSQAEKLSAWGRPPQVQAHSSTVAQEILERSEEVAVAVLTNLDKDSRGIGVPIREVSTSSDHATYGQTSPDKTDAGSTTTEIFDEGSKVLFAGEETDDVLSFQGQRLFRSTVSSGSTWQKWQKPLSVSEWDPHQLESSSVPESPAAPRSTSSEVGASLTTSIPRDCARVTKNPTSVPPAHQVPYKKRKFNIPPDAGSSMSGKTHSPSREDDGRSGKDQEQSSCPHEGEKRSGEQGNSHGRLPSFDPIGDLLKYVGPEALRETLTRNPTMVFDYVMIARALFSKQCAERLFLGKTSAERVRLKSKVVRLVAKVGGFDISKLYEPTNLMPPSK